MTLTRSNIAAPILLSSLLIGLDGCRAVGDIFKAGVWVGVIGVFVVVALVIWLVSKMMR